MPKGEFSQKIRENSDKPARNQTFQDHILDASSCLCEKKKKLTRFSGILIDRHNKHSLHSDEAKRIGGRT